jgi:hypothetical protein
MTINMPLDSRKIKAIRSASKGSLKITSARSISPLAASAPGFTTEERAAAAAPILPPQ